MANDDNNNTFKRARQSGKSGHMTAYFERMESALNDDEDDPLTPLGMPLSELPEPDDYPSLLDWIANEIRRDALRTPSHTPGSPVRQRWTILPHTPIEAS